MNRRSFTIALGGGLLLASALTSAQPRKPRIALAFNGNERASTRFFEALTQGMR